MSENDRPLRVIQFVGGPNCESLPDPEVLDHPSVGDFLTMLRPAGGLRVVVLPPGREDEIIACADKLRSAGADMPALKRAGSKGPVNYLRSQTPRKLTLVTYYEDLGRLRNGVEALFQSFEPEHHFGLFLLAVKDRKPFDGLEKLVVRSAVGVAKSAAAKKLGEDIARAAERLSATRGKIPNILLLGETGVGKSHAARRVHAQSNRCDKPFRQLNCAAIPSELFESELFGVKKGTVTGVERDRVGILKEADGGTVFLDEIAQLSARHQPKLLTFLDDGQFQVVGGGIESADVLIISASNLDLERRVKEGEFAGDLLRRLAGFEIQIPPLRERPEDIPELIRQILQEGGADGRLVEALEPFVLGGLQRYAWPRNIGELETLVWNLAEAMAEGPRSVEALLPSRIRSACLEAAAIAHLERGRSLLSLSSDRGPALGEFCGAAAWLYSDWNDDPGRTERVRSKLDQTLGEIERGGDPATAREVRELFDLGDPGLRAEGDGRSAAILAGGLGDSSRDLDFLFGALAGTETVLHVGSCSAAFRREATGLADGNTVKLEFVDVVGDEPLLRPLHYWTALANTDVVDPAKSILFVAGDGDPTLLECRLALALGSLVAAVSPLAPDIGELQSRMDRRQRGRLIELPRDPSVVRALLDQRRPAWTPEAREAVAREMHQQYLGMNPNSQDPACRPWEELDEEFKQSNLAQADDIVRKLALVGCDITPVSGAKPYELSTEEIELLAQEEHGRWTADKLRAGYRYGPEKTEHTNPNLLAWSELPDDIAEWDRKFVRAIPELLERASEHYPGHTLVVRKKGSEG